MGISEIANLATALAVIVGVVFGILQLRHMAQTRAILASAELVRAMQTPDFTNGVTVIGRLPDGADPAAVNGNPETLAAALHVGHVLECLGVLVYHRILPLHLVDDLLGGYIRMCWRKLGPQVEARRKELGVYYGEWTQWLAERLMEHPSPGKLEGAHVSHRAWRP